MNPLLVWWGLDDATLDPRRITEACAPRVSRDRRPRGHRSTLPPKQARAYGASRRSLLVQGERGGSAARALPHECSRVWPRPGVRSRLRCGPRAVIAAGEWRGPTGCAARCAPASRAASPEGEPRSTPARAPSSFTSILLCVSSVGTTSNRSCRHSSTDIPSAMRSGPAGGRLLLRGLSCAARRGCGPAAGRAVAARRGCDRAIAPSDRSRRGGADRPPRFASSRRPRG